MHNCKGKKRKKMSVKRKKTTLFTSPKPQKSAINQLINVSWQFHLSWLWKWPILPEAHKYLHISLLRTCKPSKHITSSWKNSFIKTGNHSVIWLEERRENRRPMTASSGTVFYESLVFCVQSIHSDNKTEFGILGKGGGYLIEHQRKQ